MSYDELPLEERLQRAAEYALLLNDEPNKTPGDIIDELQLVFGITKSQATMAYKNSREDFKKEYKKANVSKTWHYISVFLISITCAAFYFFIALDSGFRFFWIFTWLFALSALGLIFFLIRVAFDRIALRYPYLVPLRNNMFLSILPLTLCFCIWSGILFVRKNIVTEKDVAGAIFKLSHSPLFKKKPGKSGPWGYEFVCEGYSRPFYFYKADFIYSNNVPDFTQYQRGDTIIAEVLKTDIKKIGGYNFIANDAKIFGVWVNGKSMTDYQKRFDIIHENHKTTFIISALVLLANILIIGWLVKLQIEKQLV